MPRIIFISGIHGSGKTTLGKKLSQISGFHFVSSSEIIKKEISKQNWNNEKNIENISSNQDILCNGIKKYYSN